MEYGLSLHIMWVNWRERNNYTVNDVELYVY